MDHWVGAIAPGVNIQLGEYYVYPSSLVWRLFSVPFGCGHDYFICNLLAP